MLTVPLTVESNIIGLKLAKITENWLYRPTNQPRFHYEKLNKDLQKGLRTILMVELNSGAGFYVNLKFAWLRDKIEKSWV